MKISTLRLKFLKTLNLVKSKPLNHVEIFNSLIKQCSFLTIKKIKNYLILIKIKINLFYRAVIKFCLKNTLLRERETQHLEYKKIETFHEILN